MAETSSIASRMEKLAKLKRMKLGLAGDSSAKPDPAAAPEIAQAAPAETVMSAPEIAMPDPTPAPAIPAAEAVPDIAPTVQEPVKDEFESAFDDPAASEAMHDTGDATAQQNDVADDGFDFAMGKEAAESLQESADATDASDSEIPADLMEDEPTVAGPEDFEPEEFTVPELSETEMAADDDDSNVSTLSDYAEAEAAQEAALDADADKNDLADVAALAGVTAAVASATGTGSADTVADGSDLPDFAASEIDPELIEKEFAHETANPSAQNAKGDAIDGPVTLTFDDNRSTLLNHVSRQMNCSIEDVVVTALDWYLDALFGEEDAAKSA